MTRLAISVGAHVEELLDGSFSRGLAGFAEDVVWHVPGDGELGGDHRGREAVLALVGRLLAPRGRREGVRHQALAEHAGYVFEWLEVAADDAEGRTAHPIVSRVEDGRIREVWSCA